APEASGRPTEAGDAVQSPDILPQEGADKSVESEQDETEETESIDDIEALLELETDESRQAEEAETSTEQIKEAAVPDTYLHKTGAESDQTEHTPDLKEADESEELDESSDSVQPQGDKPADDLDSLLEEEIDSAQSPEDGTPDKVILEDVPAEGKFESSKGSDRKLRPSKQLTIVLAVVIGVAGSFHVLFYFHKRRSESIPPSVVLSFPVKNQPESSTTSSFKESSRSVYLKSFIIPAPLKRKDITYVTADIGLEFTTTEAAAIVKGHAAFFRSIIYEVMLNALESMDKSKINEISLKLMILRDLNGVLPERSLKDVVVEAFIMY
ncbi:MAG: hypothetical protein JRK26_23500, partial [Deltaproteobacteria bacterium]|nr:hypothetical protein [Deltaproteobacteria bacterium]